MKITSILMTSTLSLAAVANFNAQEADNPLMRKSPLQYQTPEFDKIKDEHFKPAFDYGLKVQSHEIDFILKNRMTPTFENTVLALENSGEVLKRARRAFAALAGANTNPTLQKLSQEYAPIFAAHNDKIYLNSDLYKKIKAVKTDKLDAESKRLVEVYLQDFEFAGANLSNADKEKMKKINGEVAKLSNDFSNKLLDARKHSSVIINDLKELDGLSDEEIAIASENAKAAGYTGKYLLTITNTTQQPLLQNLKNRATREKLFKAGWTRAEKGDQDDTTKIIEELAKLRLQKAQLLGKKSFAEWKLQDQMAKTPENVSNFLAQIAKPAVEQVKKEAKDIQGLIDQQKGGFKLEPWDWNFYAEQVRKAKFDLDENELKPYFEVNSVLENGVFFAAEKLYGITFKKRTDLPVYHPDVLVYEIFDFDGKSMALFYVDFFSRDSKRGGAWMSNFVPQSHSKGQKPVIVNVLNYQKAADGKASLISYDEVTTMFHEFGHATHGLFANQKYETLSGTAVPRDFVELPSQINEYWALHPEVLKNYAHHYQTKQPMPQSLVDKLKKSLTFNQGYMTTELVAAATLDFGWHSVTSEKEVISALDFEKKTLEKYGLLVPQAPPRYHSPYFSHIWGGGYSSGYYAYLWAEVLDSDGYQWFEENGGLNRKNGDRFRKYILSVGNTVDLNQAYKDFAGREPNIKALLKNRGFIK